MVEANRGLLSLDQYLLTLAWQYGVLRNDREMLLTEEDELIAIQLCLAEMNKQVCTYMSIMYMIYIHVKYIYVA